MSYTHVALGKSHHARSQAMAKPWLRPPSCCVYVIVNTVVMSGCWTDSPWGSSAARGFGTELKELLPLLLWVLSAGAGRSDAFTRAGGA